MGIREEKNYSCEDFIFLIILYTKIINIRKMQEIDDERKILRLDLSCILRNQFKW